MISVTGGACSGGEIGHHCLDNEHCDSGHCTRVDTETGPALQCTDGSVGLPCDAEEDFDCADGRCAKDPFSSSWTCSAGMVGDRCSDPSHCVEGTCALSGQDGECSDGKVGSACLGAGDCDLGHCYTGGSDIGYCTSGGPGQGCDEAEDCESNDCGASGACL